MKSGRPTSWELCAANEGSTPTLESTDGGESGVPVGAGVGLETATPNTDRITAKRHNETPSIAKKIFEGCFLLGFLTETLVDLAFWTAF